MSRREPVTFKGVRDGFLILLGEQDDFGVVLTQLREKLSAAGDFFQGSSAIVDVGRRELSKDEMAQLVHVLQDEHGLVLRRVVANLPERNRPGGSDGVVVLRQVTEAPAADGAPAGAEPARARREDGGKRPHRTEENTLFIHRTLRSGQRIEYDGSVVVIGDVNPGAEIIASGDILVMGTIRGLAHAGARGDSQAIVTALSLVPTQLRIASTIGRPPDDDGTTRPRPEMARVQDGRMVIEPFPGWE